MPLSELAAVWAENKRPVLMWHLIVIAPGDVKHLKADGKLHRQSLLFHVFSKISVHTFHLTGLTPFKLVHKAGSSPVSYRKKI